MYPMNTVLAGFEINHSFDFSKPAHIVNLCTQYAELAGFDFDILPTVKVGMVCYHHFRKNISERFLIVALSLVRAFGAMRLESSLQGQAANYAFPIAIDFLRNDIRQNNGEQSVTKHLFSYP